MSSYFFLKESESKCLQNVGTSLHRRR